MTKTRIIHKCRGCGKELTENEKTWHICQGRDDTVRHRKPFVVKRQHCTECGTEFTEHGFCYCKTGQ